MPGYGTSPPEQVAIEDDLSQASSVVKGQFELFDGEGDGTINRNDLAALIRGIGQFSESEIDRMFRKTGTTSGRVNYTTFIDWAFSSAQVLEHRKSRLRAVKLFQNLGEIEIEACAKVLELMTAEAGTRIINQGEPGEECFIVDSGECFAEIKVSDEWKEVMQYKAGGFFGERALLRNEPRAASITARTECKLLRLSREEFVSMLQERDHKENLIRKAKLFETMNDDQVAKLAGALERKYYQDGEKIIIQGEPGRHFYILEEGEVSATIKMADGGKEEEVKRYQKGELFGEKALLDSAPRAATVSACGSVKAFMLSREAFEKRLGPLDQLKAEQYLADPRKLISDFYQTGDKRGPKGSLVARNLEAAGEPTKWFVVYRPCSRDSIAKMLGKVGVGKGLNVKGKSAKKNRLSGFVPFIQISDNDHKADVEASPKDARTTIFYRTEPARQQALASLRKIQQEAGSRLHILDPEIKLVATYEPETWGLDVPEPLMKEAYIMQPDLSPMVGWETGRASEPAFMDMNLHSVRGNSVPTVVVYQQDLADPMNPLGLLVAYAEKSVKPVVSDFDTLLVGSTGIKYEQLPAKQKDLVMWSLDRAEELIRMPTQKGWTSRWLEVLKESAMNGFHPDIPKLGFGDGVSVSFIQDVVEVTENCGAVRHGAECFNYYFPQELDDEFLVIWDGYSDPPWQKKSERELREFLLERAAEGFGFPLNPVWPVRDPGWYEVMLALKDNPIEADNFKAWIPDEVMARIERIHDDCPLGFTVQKSQRSSMRNSVSTTQDISGAEMMDFVTAEVNKIVRERWHRVRIRILWMARMMKNMDDEEHARMLGGP
eukprot:TRINITY_DN9690_c0_g1_i1.p1 TRINITY_DN9690_c0_g1~~TRINITY_DN9690_c0_g1_i1.p1  ORF type:complete len:831 (-),score=189.00 TRINITY_DN9690_c0_g1_i1:269-2761(-)